MAALKSIFRFSGSFGLSHNLYENRLALNLGLGGVRDVTILIISHEQTLLNRVCCFQLFDGVFPKDPFI